MLFFKLISIFVFVSTFSCQAWEKARDEDFVVGFKIGATQGLLNNLSGFNGPMEIGTFIGSVAVSSSIIDRRLSSYPPRVTFFETMQLGQAAGQFLTEMVSIREGKIKPRINLTILLWILRQFVDVDENTKSSRPIFRG